MAHWSENARQLETVFHRINSMNVLSYLLDSEPAVYLLWLSSEMRIDDLFGKQIEHFCSQAHPQSTICIFALPCQAAEVLPYLEHVVQYQHWIAVKTLPQPTQIGFSNRHHALLLLTRYRAPLRHTKTRIRYSYCVACQRTIKDYGGKKHVYHEYGTLMSDVWRDIECEPSNNIDPVIERLTDLFGIAPYKRLHVIDLRGCEYPSVEVREPSLPYEYGAYGNFLDSQLINADCLEALRGIPDNSVDFCFADPPYNLKKRYDHWNDTLELQDYFAWCDLWLGELARVLKPGRFLTVINIPLWAVRHYQFLVRVLDFQAWIAWEALSFPVRLIMPAHYAILCFSKGEPRGTGLSKKTLTPVESAVLSPLAEAYCSRADCMHRRRWRGVVDTAPLSDLWYEIHRLKHNSRRVDHPCQLPPKLMQRLIALFTEPHELVLDPFNGAGTTTLVAQQMGRRFIGIEISSEYHRIALERHRTLSDGGDPFAKRTGVPKAKNSPVERLPKQRYIVPKKVLQLEIKRIAQLLGRIPTREEVAKLGHYPIEYYERYFISWGEACAAARTTGMSEYAPQNYEPTQTTLFDDLTD